MIACRVGLRVALAMTCRAALKSARLLRRQRMCCRVRRHTAPPGRFYWMVEQASCASAPSFHLLRPRFAAESERLRTPDGILCLRFRAAGRSLRDAYRQIAASPSRSTVKPTETIRQPRWSRSRMSPTLRTSLAAANALRNPAAQIRTTSMPIRMISPPQHILGHELTLGNPARDGGPPTLAAISKAYPVVFS